MLHRPRSRKLEQQERFCPAASGRGRGAACTLAVRLWPPVRGSKTGVSSAYTEARSLVAAPGSLRTPVGAWGV